MDQRDTDSASLLQVADLVLDRERRRVTRDGVPVDLTDRSYRLFEVLVRHAPEEVSKDELIAEVWDDAVVSDETLAQRVRLLRQSLGDDSQNPRYVASVRGRGYRLVASVGDAVTVEPASEAPEPRGNGLRRFMISAVALVVIVLAWQGANSPPVSDADALAVLPFKDMSASQDHQFFADGMQEELLSRLAQIDKLAVVSRTSVERYRDNDTSVSVIAKELGVDAIIEGSIRVDGDRLRVTVQLIDAETDEHIWASNFDRQLSVQNIFALQEDVANQIASSLQLEYVDASSSSAPLPTTSIEAYNLYLLGRYHTFRQTLRDLEEAVGFLEQAVAIDPEFAEAYASLGWAYSFLGAEYGTHLPDEMYPKAREVALRALALNANLADARSLYADILTWYDWDFVAAEREYKKTMEFDPYNVLGYALFLSTQERHDEAVALIERRLATQPSDPYVNVNAGWRYLHAGMNEEAAAAAKRAGDHADSASIVGFALLAEGEVSAAVALFESELETRGRTPVNAANLAVAYYRNDQRDAADALLGDLADYADENYIAPGLMAGVYFAAGDADRGFAELERGFNERTRDMIFLRVTPTLNNYRDDPRYQDLLSRVRPR